MTADPLTAALAKLPGRCPHGRHLSTMPCGDCAPTAPADEKAAAYQEFKRILREAVRDDGTLHACDMRPRTRDRFEPRLLSSCWRKARADRLLVEVGHERSDDERGKNAGRMEPYYELRVA